MTSDQIIPCVCTPHPPTCADKTTYGMPVLTVCGYISRKQFWKIKCPVCGRGGLTEFRSAYKALKDWNHIMELCYKMEKKEVVFYDDFEKYYDPVSGKPYPEYQSRWDDLSSKVPNVRHGRWVKLGKHDWACSVCKIGVPYAYTGYNYCPRCGAKMDLELVYPG